MDSINSILSNKDFTEADDITKLKDYIKEKYRENASVRLHKTGLVISVTSSGLANTLSLNLPKIKRELDITSPLVIRIA